MIVYVINSFFIYIFAMVNKVAIVDRFGNLAHRKYFTLYDNDGHLSNVLP
jgi:hypothetical protein